MKINCLLFLKVSYHRPGYFRKVKYMDINKCNIPQKACYREEGNEKWAVVAQRSDGFCLKWTKRSSAKKVYSRRRHRGVKQYGG